jgi:hypothetical protein
MWFRLGGALLIVPNVQYTLLSPIHTCMHTPLHTCIYNINIYIRIYIACIYIAVCRFALTAPFPSAISLLPYPTIAPVQNTNVFPMYVYTCLSVYLHVSFTHAHSHTHTHISSDLDMYINMHTHTHAWKFMPMHALCLCMRKSIDSCTHTWTRTYAYACMYTNPWARTHTCTYMHAHKKNTWPLDWATTRATIRVPWSIHAFTDVHKPRHTHL